MNREEIEERIRVLAKNTDSLIVRLDTLTNRIDTARVNQNQELVEYYERQFADLSVEFMDGIETILDSWYTWRGAVRPPAGEEAIDSQMLDEIHNSVVGIVQGISAAYPQVTDATMARLDTMRQASSGEAEDSPEEATPQMRPRRVRKDTGNKVDITG